MKQILLIFIAGAIILSSCGKKADLHVKLKSESDTVSYLMGLYFARYAKQNAPEKMNAEAVARAFQEVFNGDSIPFTEEQVSMKLQAYFMKLQQKKASTNKEAAEKFMAENKKKDGIITTPSGLQYKVEKEGTGVTPDSSDMVSVNYTGTLINGEEFDSSMKNGGHPAKFMVTQVIPGFTEALLKMKVGSKWKIFVPWNLGYGERVRPGGKIEPDMALIFEVELLSIEPKGENNAPKPGMPMTMKPGRPVKK
jgi:FKBP-type peptidyl-prolyl cis-trans isomerase